MVDKPLTVCKKTLFALQHQHLTRIPFDNMDIHMSRPIVVDKIEPILEKMLVNNRGGFCIEQNQAFYHLLQALGFDAKMLFCHATVGLLPGQFRPRTHLMIFVVVDGERFVVDVAGSTVGTPLPLSIDHEDVQWMNEEPHRVQRVSDREFIHQHLYDDGQWRDIKAFHIEMIANYADCNMINW